MVNAPALDVLRTLHASTRAAGLPPPAALVGDWWGADAVIAPSITLRPGFAPPDNPRRFWFGYLGFPVRAMQSPVPNVAGGLTADILVLRDGQWSYESVDDTSCPSWVRQALDEPMAPPTTPQYSAEWIAPQRDSHLAVVEQCLAAIRAGEVYQACVCTRFTGRITGDPVEFFASLTGTTMPAKAAFLQGDWGTVASFSPETFLRRTGNIVSSSPIKGTVAAHVAPDELSSSAKDVAENVMIVDLVRNDLSRVAVTGTVRVPDLLSVVRAPGVWHLVSRVEAILDPLVGNNELLQATFPPASVTGTPKIRAAELLAGWEPHPRGVYCGAVGVAGPGQELDLNVAIRTVTLTPDGNATLGVGGGITIDSEPLREWQECLDKAASITGHSGLFSD